MFQRWAVFFLLFILFWAFIFPSYAHTTLGILNDNPSLYRSDDHQLNPTNRFLEHVPGPLGYVWPGSGLNMYSDKKNHPPGYQSPFTTFELPLQVAGNAYAPEGAILTSTFNQDNIGDFIFAINFSDPKAFISDTNPNPDFSYKSISLYIPAPVFDKTGTLIQDGFEPAGGISWDEGDTTNIVTTITDNYGNIFISRADRDDPFQPGSWLLTITTLESSIDFTSERKWTEWYYIRINQMKAPHIAGRYFFKIFLDNHYPLHQQEPDNLINSTMPMENWPVLLVKGETDPGIIWGTIRHGGIQDADLYGKPLHLPGKVRAVGTAINPTTGKLTGRTVEARGYFNASSKGHFEVEGVAPGIYDLYVSAAGYPEQKVTENIGIRSGQSLKIELYVKVGPVIKGRVFSKVETGLQPWPNQRPVSVIIYNSDTYNQESIVAYSPINLTHAPYTSYAFGNIFFNGAGLNPPNYPKPVAFPWEGPVGYYPNTIPPTYKDPLGIFNGVGPAQVWWIDPSASVDPSSMLGSSQTDFTFQFGSHPFYGIPTESSGMIPQIFATWTDSLSPGTYYIRVFINGYVQTSSDGVQFIDYPFRILDIEHPRDIFVPIDLLQSKSINLTIHFHNLPNTIINKPIQGPDPNRYLIAEAFSSDGTLSSLNFTQVSYLDGNASIMLNGFGMAGPLHPPDPRAFIKYSLARYRGLSDYGLPSDTYTIRIFMRGYIQAFPPAIDYSMLDQPVTVTISIGVGSVEVSTHMYRGCGINATVYPVDWEHPHNFRNWTWNTAPVNILIYDVGSQKFVDTIYFWSSIQNQWITPTQKDIDNVLPWSDWKSVYGSGSSYLTTNGSTFIDRFGPDLPSANSLYPSQDMATNIFLQEISNTGFLYSAFFYRTDGFRSTIAIYPGIYALNVWTYGYVQKDISTLGDLGDIYVTTGWLGCQADTSLYTIMGINFTFTIIFKSEDLVSGIPFNASVRLRVFDETDTIVGATILSRNGGKLSSTSSAGFFADGKKITGRTIPAGTKILSYNSLAGFLGYVEPTSSAQERVERSTLFSPDQGIWGHWTDAGSYQGSWTIMVDIINWYYSNQYYPPVPGLLQGESPYFLPYNHIGPYMQKTTITIPNIAQGGESSVEFALDLRGYLCGVILGLDWNGDARTISLARLEIVGNQENYFWYSWDGWFDGYLNPGDYQIIVNEWSELNEGHKSEQFNTTVSAGQFSETHMFLLYLSGIPIPEFSSGLFMMLSILIICLGFIEIFGAHARKRKKIIQMN